MSYAFGAKADPHAVESEAELRKIYDLPSDMIIRLKQDYLHDHAIHYISLAPIIAISSGTDEGFDSSPRGGKAGFVHVLDRKTIAIPDWPGNNKLETMANLLRNPRCGILFMTPRLDAFLRINGLATLTRDPDLLSVFEEQGRSPKMAVRVSVEEAYFHCGKAFHRSGIWRPETWPDVTSFPKSGKMIEDIANLPEGTAEALEAKYQQGMKNELY